jgi:3-phosphoshikimate 1-carboxyvinyltransferase
MSRQYPATYSVQPITHSISKEVRVPGSKSLTNRALVLAALAARNGECRLTGALNSEDTEVMITALKQLGFSLEEHWNDELLIVRQNQSSRLIPASEGDLFVANSGTTIRFLTAMLSLAPGRYRLDGISRMRERPIQDLLDALRELGVSAISEAGTGCPPVVVSGNGWQSAEVSVAAGTSSQFLSALLMAAAFRAGETRVRTIGPRVSEPYIAMTVEQLRSWGAEVHEDASGGWRIVGTPSLKPPAEYAIEPDASAASYFFAAAAINGGRVTVAGMKRDMLQGDVLFIDALKQMGCRIEECDTGITVHGKPLHGIDIDMNAISDTVMSLAVVACFATGSTTIRNVGHIRHKETDRVNAIAVELRKLGVLVEEFADGLTLTPRELKGCALDTYNDHRMAMSLALIGLKLPGVVINNPGCVAKTYPGFWQDFESLSSPV